MGFPWPVLFVPAVMMFIMFGRGSKGCAASTRAPDLRLGQSATFEDPLVTLRERFAHGEIGDNEFGQSFDVLSRSEPGQTLTPRTS